MLFAMIEIDVYVPYQISVTIVDIHAKRYHAVRMHIA